MSGDIVVTWLIDHGIRILVILVVGAVLWFALNRFLQPIVRRTVGRNKYKERKEGLKKVRIFYVIGQKTVLVTKLLLM